MVERFVEIMRPLAYQRALDLFIESMIKPDYELRANAGYQDCYGELMEIRQSCITYVRTLKEINDIESGDESDAIEVGKTLSAKLSSQRIAFTHGELI